jgi:hypothetical protein
MDKLYSPKGVTELWPGITEGQLKDWRFHGTGPRFKKVGKKILYAERDLISFLEGATRTQTGELVR